jgi:hypothetical protein
MRVESAAVDAASLARPAVRAIVYPCSVTLTDDNERIIAEAVAALPGIAAALEPQSQPADGSWVALTVHSGEEGDDVIHRAFFTWRYDAPLEPLEESPYLDLTRDQEKGVIKVPVWSFGLTPQGPDEWRLDYWFAAPLRMWIGPRAGDRIQSMGLTYVARRSADGWTLDSGDILAG